MKASSSRLRDDPLPGDAARLDVRVRAALLNLVYNDQPLSLTAALVFSGIVTGLLAYVHPAAFHWWWMAGMTATLGARYVMAMRYRRAPVDVADVRAWEWRFFAGAVITAAFWGAIVWYAYPVATPSVRVAVVLLIGGIVAVSSRTIACHLPSFFVYEILSALPLIADLLLRQGSTGAMIAAFASLYILLMLGLGVAFRKTMAKSLRLQFENADLAAQLRRDIAAREAAEQALRASENRLSFAQYALDQAQDLVAIVDAEGNFLHVSGAFCRATGRTTEELTGTKIWDGVVELDRGQFRDRWEQVKRAGARTFESHVFGRAGEDRLVEVNATFVEFNGREAICAIARDVAQRRAAEEERARLQQQFQETQRLESLGVLAGGIAHDFNNLLTAILGNATLARDTLTQPLLLSEMLGQIETAANQAAGLCRQMLAYAGRGELWIEPLNLSEVVAESARLLELTVSRRARLDLRLDPTLPSILADASQLRQVVMNLVHNAAEAIHHPDGRIVVTTSPVLIDQNLISAARIRTDIPVGEGVALLVSDNGGGMDRATLDRIFEPFFTTKFTGRGLGLPAVLGIVRSHRAVLHVESTIGKGSTFRVVFAAAETPATAKPPPTATLPLRRQGTALVIEDEESVRELTRQILERIGLTVEVAVDGKAAIAAVEHDPERFDVLLVDMAMPGIDGAITLDELRRRGASAPAIMMSGLSEQQVNERMAGAPLAGFLPKPFDVERLRGIIESVLDQVGGSGETAARNHAVLARRTARPA